MFLVTTANERAWKMDEKILFLGKWCTLFEKREKWSKLDFETLPYHWDDSQKLYKDHLYLNDLYEEILVEISEWLNQIHGVNHSIRYWRIIVGLWLLGFIHTLYDRYQSIVCAAESGKVDNTFIVKSDLQYVPQNFEAFVLWATESDNFNFYLYSQIIAYTQKVPFEYLDIEKDGLPTDGRVSYTQEEPFSLKKIMKGCLRRTPQIFNKVVIVESTLEAKDVLKLQLALQQLPYLPKTKVNVPKEDVRLDIRERLQLQPSEDEFRAVLGHMIKEQIPALYVEGYARMCQLSLKAYSPHPKAIFNGVAFNITESFKFWAAYHAEHHVKLWGYQHGGMYGSGFLSIPEDHQIKIYDTFYTWGWISEKYENTRPLTAAKLNHIADRIGPKKNGRLLLIETAIPRYSFLPEMFCTSSSGFLAYLDEQFRFVDGLSEENKKRMLVRLYMHDYGWQQKRRWQDKFPMIACSGAGESMASALNESCLAIGTHNTTTYLETFVADFPTVLFWNPEHWKVRKAAQPYFDRLREVGILYDTPESAAEKINEIAVDPMSWWIQPDIQEAKNKFCLQFAKTSDNWIEEWADEFRCQIRS
jgi:putative transferase (TIGR04331 family)